MPVMRVTLSVLAFSTQLPVVQRNVYALIWSALVTGRVKVLRLVIAYQRFLKRPLNKQPNKCRCVYD